MCELLGMSFNQVIRPSISFQGFRNKGNDNPHGWGIAFYPDEAASVIKEPIRAGASQMAEFIESYSGLRSKIIISHVRYISHGEIAFKNTHPFQRELAGSDFVFAHNGTIRFRSFPLGKYHPIGKTDSEHIFCYLLSCIEARGIISWTGEDFVWLGNLLREINRQGDLNCIFSDGVYMFCYHDQQRYKGLHFVQRKAPFSQVRMLDEDFVIDLAEEKSLDQEGYIIATRPLSDENWVPFDGGELIVLKEGQMVFSSSGRPLHDFGSEELMVLKFIRQSPHKVSIKTIIENLGLSHQTVKASIKYLSETGFLRQDRNDICSWDSLDANYYTQSARRQEIDALILN